MADASVKDISQSVQNPEPKIRNFGWRLDAVALGAILLLLVLLMRDALFSSTLVIGARLTDGATQHFPWRVFGYETWRTSGLPLWNPYDLLGMPFIANLQSAMFYPTNLLCLLLPIPIACNLSVLINLFLSSAFTYVLARALKLSRPGACLAALTYALSANHLFRVYQGNWAMVNALPWAPFLTLCAEMIARQKTRSWLFVVLGGCGVALQALAGQPQILLYTSIFAGIYFLVRLFGFGEHPETGREIAGRIAMFAALFALGAVLASAQLLPAWKLTQASSRSDHSSLSWVGSYALPPQNLLTLIAPHAFGPVVKGGSEVWQYWGLWNFWETGLYMGLVSLMLLVAAMAAVNWRRWLPFAVPGVFFFLLALGPNGLLLGILYGRVPAFDLFRAPGRALPLAGLSVGMIAGLGLDVILSGTDNRRRRLRIAFAVLAALILASAALVEATRGDPPGLWGRFVTRFAAVKPNVGIAGLPTLPPQDFLTEAWRVVRDDMRWAALLAIAAAAFAFTPVRRPRLALWAALALVLLAALDLYHFGRPFMVTFDSRDRIWNDRMIAEFQQENRTSPFRISNRADPAEQSGDQWYRYVCQPMTYGLSSLDGIEPNVPIRWHDFYCTAEDRDPAVPHTNFRVRKSPALYDLINLRYITEPGPASADGTPTCKVIRRPGALPRAFIVHKYEVVSSRTKTLRLLRTWNHEPVVLLESAPKEPCEPAQGEEPVPVFKRYDARGAEILVHANSAGFLVLSDLYYPGWVARVDGKPAKIHCADYLMRAVAVPAGEHTVEFAYAAPEFVRGAVASAIAGFLVLIYFVVFAWKAYRGRKSPLPQAPRD